MESEDQPISRDMYCLLSYQVDATDTVRAIQIMKHTLELRGYSPGFIETMEFNVIPLGAICVVTAGYYIS